MVENTEAAATPGARACHPFLRSVLKVERCDDDDDNDVIIYGWDFDFMATTPGG